MLLLVASSAFADPRCLTPELRLQRQELPSSRAVSMTRPDEAGFVDSTLYPIRIHYRKAEDADRAADVILPLAEDVWRVEIEEMGWIQPPADYGAGGSDAYDIYLTNEQTFGGAYTYTTYDNGVEPDVYDGDALFTNSSYIAIDDNQNMLPDDLMPAYVSHEFNHALQYATDANEYTLFAWESVAEATALIYSGLSQDFKIEVSDFQGHPSLSILFDSYMRAVSSYDEETWYYEYGGWIFSAFVEQKYGTGDGSTLRELWTAMAAGSRADEPDFLDGLGAVSGSDDASDLFLAFSEWRMLLASYDDGAHYAEGAELPNSALPGTEGTLTLSEVGGTTVSPTEEPYDLGNSIWMIEVDEASTQELVLTVTGDEGVRWGVTAAAFQEGGPARVIQARVAEGETLETALDLTGAQTVFVAVANLGASNLDPEDIGPFEKQTFELSFALQDAAPPEDTGPDAPAGDTGKAVAEEDGGCGCASTPGPGLAVALAGLLLVRRRR